MPGRHGHYLFQQEQDENTQFEGTDNILLGGGFRCLPSCPCWPGIRALFHQQGKDQKHIHAFLFHFALDLKLQINLRTFPTCPVSQRGFTHNAGLKICRYTPVRAIFCHCWPASLWDSLRALNTHTPRKIYLVIVTNNSLHIPLKWSCPNSLSSDTACSPNRLRLCVQFIANTWVPSAEKHRSRASHIKLGSAVLRKYKVKGEL